MQQEPIRVQGGHDIEGDVREVHQPRPDGQGEHEPELQFDVNAQERQKWQEEMAENDKQADVPPGPLLAPDVPEGFLGNVGVPDDEILEEGDVSVEHGEREHQRADEIEGLFRGHFA